LVLDGVPDGTASKGDIYIDELTTVAQSAEQAPAGSTAAAATPVAAGAAATTALSGRIAVPIFANDRRQYDLYVGNIDGSNLQRVNAQASQPTVKANGQQMVFRDWDSGNRSLMAMDTYGGNQRRLTNFGEDGLPSFSPNGQTVVFSSAREPDRKGRIYQVNVAGGPDWQLKIGTDPIFGEYPAWLSNGQIAYKGDFPQQGIVVMNADGAAPRLLVDDGSATAPAGSPDSQSIAFMSQRDGNWEVYRVNLDGSGLVRLTNNGANDGLGTGWPFDRLPFRPRGRMGRMGHERRWQQSAAAFHLAGFP
jgi:Tol biopolymer transport system component